MQSFPRAQTPVHVRAVAHARPTPLATAVSAAVSKALSTALHTALQTAPALVLALAFVLTSGAALAQGAPATLRPEIAPPLVAAQKALGDKQFDEALAQLRAADAVAGKTAYETYLVERLRFVAAAGKRDAPLALRSIEAALATGQAEPELRATLMDQASNTAYGLKDYERTVQWARRAIEAGATGSVTSLRLAQALYFQGQHPAAGQALDALATRQRAAGEAPGEPQLRLQASNLLKMNDDAGYAGVLEDLLLAYPKPAVWSDRLARLSRQSGFDDRLMLDLMRLGQRVQAWETPQAQAELVELALQAGFVNEARGYLDAAYAKGLLGQGPDAARHQTLRQRVQSLSAADRAAGAPDARALAARDAAFVFSTGWDQYTAGRQPEGLALMQQAVQRGLSKNPDDARLRLAGALAASGQTEPARAMLIAVRDAGHRDGLSDLARLWLLQVPAPR